MQPSKLQLTKQVNGEGSPAVTRLDGKLSLETVSEFLQTMRSEGEKKLVLDMSGVSFLDSAGVGALVQLFVHRKNHGQTLAIASLTPQGNAVMQVAGLLKYIPTFPTVGDALAA